jgi:hypothetical protein
MATMTDPAQELGEIAKRLAQGSSHPGARFLAEQFGVKAWSTDFYRIITCILERADLVATIVGRSTLDDEVRSNALNEVEQFKAAFALGPLHNAWNNAGHGLTIMRDHGRPIQYLTQTVRAEVSYPKLNSEEVTELLSLVDAYLAELNEEDVPEFVRQAIRDGLTRFKFQLQHLGWMGSGYLLAAFREVLLVYEDSSRQLAANDLDAGAVLKGLGAILTKFKTTVESAKGWADAAQTVWKAYQVGTSIATPLLLTWAGIKGG